MSFLPSVSIRAMNVDYIKKQPVFYKDQLSLDTLKINHNEFNKYA